jgi:hypothetical protein
MEWMQWLAVYVLGFLCTFLLSVKSERKSSQRTMDGFNKDSWSNIVCASALWPLLYAIAILYISCSFIFSGKMKKLLTTEVLRERNRVDIPINTAPRASSPNLNGDSFQNVMRQTYGEAYRESMARTINSFPESDEGKPIHIIGIIPDKMVSSYEADQSGTEEN